MLIVVAVNYVAISEALGLSPSVLAAGVAADNVICAVYFMILFALASNIPAESAPPTDGIFFSRICCYNCSWRLQFRTMIIIKSFIFLDEKSFITKFLFILNGILSLIS